MAIAAAIAVLLVVLIVARHAIASTVIGKAVSIATGYDVTIGNEQLGTRHAVLWDVHVTKNGDPVLDAQRVDVDYALRDIFPGGAHRFGFASIAIQRPVLTIVRHADGSLSFNRPGGTGAAPPAQTRKAVAPYYFTARVRDGTINLVDKAPLQPDLAYQTIAHVNIDASVKSDARTTARIGGVLLGRRRQGEPVIHYPLQERTVIDVHRGIALNAITAPVLPIRGVLGFLIHSPSVRFDDGVIDHVNFMIYALAPKAGEDFAYRLGGGFTLDGARIAVAALAKPIRDLRGRVDITGDTMATDTLTGSVGGMPLRGRGAFYDLFGGLRLWLGMTGDGNLATLRSLFTFANNLPLSGPLHVETLLADRLSSPLIRNAFTIPHIQYDRYPFEDVSGLADVYDGAVVVEGVRARFGSMRAGLGGRVVFGDRRGDDIVFALDANGPGASLPYADMLAPDSDVHATALVMQIPGMNGWRAKGTVGAQGFTDGGLTFAVDEKGVGEFGPLFFTRQDGSSLAGGFELQRPISQSAGWIRAHGFRLSGIRAAALPGVTIPAFPALSGVLDGELAAGGTPDAFGVAGTMHARDLRFQNYALGSGSVDLDGTFADLRLANIDLSGPMGRFAGDGAFANNVFALSGTYDGSLQALQPFIGGDVAMRGAVHGPVRATIAAPSTSSGQTRIVVQTTGASLAGASVRGIPLERVAGTLLVQGKSLRVIAADANVGGGHAVVADAGGPFIVSAPAVPADALRGAGLPLQGGTLSLFGLADLGSGAPTFDGAVALTNGVADGYPVSGGAAVRFARSTATVSTGIAAVGATYGAFSGTIGVTGGPTYDLNANVPLGDVGDVRRVMRLPLRTLDGSFSADVHVGGGGARPRVIGHVISREGSYNGLAFHDAQANVDVSPTRAVAQDGSVIVGGTHAAVDASVAGRAFSVSMRSARANLADFNDYFDEAETLAGNGSFAFAFANDGRSTRTSGRVAMDGVRYRRFPFGTTVGSWSDLGGQVRAALAVTGDHGGLRANGTVVPAPGGPVAAFRNASMNVRVAASNVALDTWLPPFGITAPILGQVDANAAIAGRWPHLGVNLAANLRDGSIVGYKVQRGTIHARTSGNRIALSDTTLDFGFARFDANGTIGMNPRQPLALAIHGQSADVGATLADLLPKRRFDIAGAMQADARITGTLAHPLATVGFDLTNARYKTLAIPHVLGSVAYNGTTLEVQDAEATFAKGNAFVAGSLPFSLQPFGIRPTAPLSFTLALGGLDLAPFAPFVPGPQTKLGGTVDGRVSIEGTTQNPRVVGDVTLAGGSYVSGFDKAPITGANATLIFNGTSVALQALNANVGGGTLTGTGSVDLPFPNAPPSGYAATLVAHNARFDLPAYASGQLNGTVQLARSGSLPLISGNVTLDRTTIPFSSLVRMVSGGGAAESAGAAGPPFDLAFNLMMNVANARVSGSIVDVGAHGALDLTGTLSHPKLDGTLTANPGGYISTYNHVFRLQQATVAFDPANGVVPTIDARAFAHVTNPDPDPTRNAVGSADITITVRGPADELASGGTGITYSSNPPYDQTQIVGLLLDASVFGAVNFGQQQNGTLLRGAPPATNPLLPPGVTPYQSATLNLNQEAFSFFNGQLVQRFLAPIERVLTGPLGLSDLELTVDYGGGVGYEAYKQIGHRDIYANFGQTLTAPGRTTLGFTARPDATTSILFNYYRQNGVPSITSSVNGAQLPSPQRLKGISPLTSPGGFTFSIVRKYP